MGISARVSDFLFPEGGERDDFAGQRRARIEERRAFHEGRFAGAGDIRKSLAFIDLEPIEPIQAEAIEEETAQSARSHRGSIINIEI